MNRRNRTDDRYVRFLFLVAGAFFLLGWQGARERLGPAGRWEVLRADLEPATPPGVKPLRFHEPGLVLRLPGESFDDQAMVQDARGWPDGLNRGSGWEGVSYPREQRRQPETRGREPGGLSRPEDLMLDSRDNEELLKGLAGERPDGRDALARELERDRTADGWLPAARTPFPSVPSEPASASPGQMPSGWWGLPSSQGTLDVLEKPTSDPWDPSGGESGFNF